MILSVRDNGIGIAADQLSAVFEMFTQVDRSSCRAQGGLGIGLTLVRSLVAMHGGRVEARSEGLGRAANSSSSFPSSTRACAISLRLRPSRSRGGGSWWWTTTAMRPTCSGSC